MARLPWLMPACWLALGSLFGGETPVWREIDRFVQQPFRDFALHQDFLIGVLPCEGVRLLEFDGDTPGREIGAINLDGEMLGIGVYQNTLATLSATAVHIVNLDDPTQPTLLKTLPLPDHFQAKTLQVLGEYVYVGGILANTQFDNMGLYAVQLTAADPQLATVHLNQTVSYHDTWRIDSEHLYVQGGGLLRVYDMSSPLWAWKKRDVSLPHSYFRSLFSVQGLLLLSDANSIYVFDPADPYHGRYIEAGITSHHTVIPLENGLLLVDLGHTTHLDLSDPSQPQTRQINTGNTFSPLGYYHAARDWLLFPVQGGLEVYQNALAGDLTQSFIATGERFPPFTRIVRRDNLIAAFTDFQLVLFAFDPQHGLELLSTTPVSSLTADLFFVGDTLYVQDARVRATWWRIFDIENPRQPQVLDVIGSKSLKVSDNLAVSRTHTAATVYDLQNPAVPMPTATFDFSDQEVLSMALEGDLLWLRFEDQVGLVDLTNPAKPVRYPNVTLPTPPFSATLHARDNRLWVAHLNGVWLYELQNGAIVTAGAVDNVPVGDVAIDGNTLLISSQLGFSSFDMTDPAQPRLLDQLALEPIYSFTFSQPFMSFYLVETRNHGLQALDVADPTDLKALAFDGEDYLATLTIDGNLAFGSFACPGGLSVRELSLCTTLAVEQAPVETLVCLGEDATLSVDAVGQNMRYQWFRNETPIAGANAASLTITAPGETAWFSCQLTSDCGELTTEPVAVRPTACSLQDGYATWQSNAYFCQTPNPTVLAFVAAINNGGTCP